MEETLKRITFKQAEALAAEKGTTLTRESDVKFRKNNTITTVWYKLSTSDKKFPLLTDVRVFLLKKETQA
jgi:hypothetical protein